MSKKQELQPRKYQTELLKIALEQNTIIYLPTGSGKTFIALLVLKQLSEPLSIPYNAGGKVSCILVNSVALVDQHAKYIREHTIFNPGSYTGEMNVDFWSQMEWDREFAKHNVLIMTAQILLNLLSSSFIDLAKINLLIFDECHCAVEDHSMRQIMKYFQGRSELPRVIGLTATLLNRNCKKAKVLQEVKNLEVTFHSKVATVDGMESVVGYSTNPQEKFCFCAAPSLSLRDSYVLQHLEEIVGNLLAIRPEQSPEMCTLPPNLQPLEPVDILKGIRNYIQDLVFHVKVFGTFGAFQATLCYLIQIERDRLHCDDVNFCTILNYATTSLAYLKKILQLEMNKYNSELEKIYRTASDKLLNLVQILKSYQTKSELCCLIFVERRFTAKVLYHILTALAELDPELSHLKVNFVVGNSNNPFNNTCEPLFITKKNREVVEQFANHEINVLISTRVLEEGIDIPKCTLVVKFDKCLDYRSYIQSKGRARHKDSIYYTMVELEDREKYLKKYEEFQEIEDQLNWLLIGKNAKRDAPNDAEIEEMYNEDLFPPYFVNGPNSASVSMLTGVSLLCRYCSSLTNSIYADSAPEWYAESKEAQLRVVIHLPLTCPIVEPIVGPYLSTKKDAKRAAALQACIQLHKIGELDDNLLPFSKELNEEDFTHLFGHWPEEKERDAGNKKKKRLHTKQTANCVLGKIEQNQLHLHIIRLNPTAKLDNTTVQDLYKSDLCFGLLSPHPLPDLCKFPLFDSNGSIEIDIVNNVQTLTFTSDEMMQLREFHFLVFNDILQILKPFFVFDNNQSGVDMLLVVPVRDKTIDFDVVHQHKVVKSNLEPTASERMTLQVDEESYWHKIVSPWYRPQTQMYVVSRVCYEKNAFSPFPNSDYATFASYFDEKHDLKVLNPSQPLLLVKCLSTRLNTFKPRGIESKRRKDKQYEENEEYLIAEHCIKQDFPASLWVQARFLPSILCRLSFLLKLHQLQSQIARDIGAKESYLKNCPALELDLHLLSYTPTDTPQADVEMVDVSSDKVDEIVVTSVTQQYNKDYAAKMLEAEYFWKNIEEPKDVERDINVSLADIEYYETFISQKVKKEERMLKNDSPRKLKLLPAIDYRKDFHEKHIQLLDIEFDNQVPNLCLFYQALTAAEANDIVNLERLETLGDSFLKIMSSLYITFKYDKFNEGKCTTLKGRLVSNKNLYYLAQKKNLGGIMRNSNFSPKEDWMPPCFCIPPQILTAITDKYSINSVFNCNIPAEEQISGVLSQDSLDFEREELSVEENSYPGMCHYLNKQYVGDKSMADSVEALLGAFFITGGFKGALRFTEWMGILPKSENVEDLIQSTQVDPVLSKKATKAKIMFHIPQWRELEMRLNYNFKNHGFLLQALTHSSYTPNRITQSYERLEFLGDAILDFLITCYIYEHCGYLSPGQVTDLRSALVNNNTFASLSVRCGFHKFLLMLNPKLQQHIDRFAEYLARKNYVIDDEVLILLEEEDMNIAEQIDVPKVLGDLFEALIGAIYLDCGKDLKLVWQVVYKIMWKEIDLFSKDVPKNVIRRLYECHTAYPNFRKPFDAGNQRIMVALEFMCDGRRKRVYGFGANKSMAKRAAAKIALRSLET